MRVGCPGGGSTRSLRQAQGRLSEDSGPAPSTSSGQALRQAQDRLTTNGGASGSIGVLGPGWGRRGKVSMDEALRPEDPSPISAEDAGILRLAQDRFCLSPRRGEDRGDDGWSACEGWVPGGWFDSVPSASSGQALRRLRPGPFGKLRAGHFDKLRTGSPRTGVRRDDGERRKARSLGGPRDDRWVDEALRPEDPSPTSAEDAGILRLAQDRFCLSPRRGEDRRDRSGRGGRRDPSGDLGMTGGWTRRCDRKTPHRLPPKTPESFDWLRTGSASPPGEGKIAGMTEGSACEGWVPGGWFDTVLRRLRPGSPRTGWVSWIGRALPRERDKR